METQMNVMINMSVAILLLLLLLFNGLVDAKAS